MEINSGFKGLTNHPPNYIDKSAFSIDTICSANDDISRIPKVSLHISQKPSPSPFSEPNQCISETTNQIVFNKF